MKYAKSIARLGELVAADTADYDTYKQLLLTCPHCNSSVFLRSGHNRAACARQLKDGRSIEIKAQIIPNYFAHHGGESLECEHYDRGITPDRVAKSISIARHQRSDIFNARALEIFRTTKLLRLFGTSNMTAAEWEKNLRIVKQDSVISCEVPATLLVPKAVLNFSLKAIEPILEHCVNWPFAAWGKQYLELELPRIYETRIRPEDRVGDYQSQAAYTEEFLTFLYARSNRRMLTNIFRAIACEICCLKAAEDGRHVLNSSRFLDRNFDRAYGIKTLQQMLNQDLLMELDSVVFRVEGVDSGMRIPIVILIGMLMTIDWEAQFKQYITK